MEQVIAVLFEFVNAAEGVVAFKSMVKMSINDCLELARLINTTDPNHLAVCAPDLTNSPTEH